MRVLLVNPRYPQTFWSFEKILRMLGKKVLMPPLGLITVASLLPREWDLKVADLTAGELTEDDWSQCDAVMVTGMVNQGSGMFETIKEGKRRGKMVVAGGPLVFHLPDDSLSPWVDIIVRGEAEEIAASLVSAMKRRERGVVIRATNWPDMSASPPPRYDLLDMGLYTDMVVQFSRGCPFLCEFCDITLMFGRKVRTKAPEQILAELQILYDLGWRRAVFFVDDNFIGSTNRAKELLRKLIPWMEDRGHPFDFMTQASVNLGKDDELLDLMARAGFHSVFLGIESTDKKSLILTKKFQNAATDLDLACQKINSAGLKVVAGCIIGFDNEEPGADQRLIDFANRNQIPEMFVTMLQAGPGTGLFKRLQAEGRVGVLELTDHLGSQTGLINFEPSRPKKEIAEEFIRVYDVLYEPEKFLDRAFAHLSAMKPLPYKKAFSAPYYSEIRAVAIAIVKQGLLYSSRGKFWKYLFTGLLKFPDQIRWFLTYCVKMEHFLEYRRTVADELRKKLVEEEMNEQEDFPAAKAARPM